MVTCKAEISHPPPTGASPGSSRIWGPADGVGAVPESVWHAFGRRVAKLFALPLA
jgi:hypothetical protein